MAMDASSPSLSPCLQCGTLRSKGADKVPCPVCSLRLGLEDLQGITLTEPQCGDLIGHWRIESVVGRGGNGTVLLADDPISGQTVAVKLLSAELSHDETARFRFEWESSLQFDHLNIIPVLGQGEYAGRPYLVMPYYQGGSLASWITDLWGDTQQSIPQAATKARFYREVALRLAAIARAVAHAHERGVIHRDLKPANILLDSDGIPYVGDFGISRTLGEDVRVTLSGVVLGTAGYLAPEFAAGSQTEVTTACDIYGLGAILFEMLTGLPPHEGSNVMATLQAAANSQTPTPRWKNRLVPADLDLICRTCLAREPSNRYSSARALAEDLERFARAEPILAQPPSAVGQLRAWARRNPQPAVLAVAFVALLVASLLILTHQWQKTLAAESAVQRWAEQQRQRIVTLWIARGEQAARSNDYLSALSWFLAAWKSDAQSPTSAQRGLLHEFRFQSALRRLPCLESIIPAGGQVQALNLSDDGAWMVAATRNEPAQVWQLDSSGHVVQNFRLPWRSFNPVAFAPDKTCFLASFLSTNQERKLVAYDLPTVRERFRIPLKAQVLGLEFSPDGQYFAACFRDGEVRVWDAVHGTPASPVMMHRDEARKITWVSEERLASIGWDGMAHIWEWKTGKAVLSWKTREYLRSLVCSPRRDWMAFGGDDRTVTVVDLETGQKRFTLQHPGWITDLVTTPDGKWLATADNSGNLRIWDSQNGQPTTSWLNADSSPIRSLGFNKTGKFLAATALDRTLRVWKTQDGSPVAPHFPIVPNGYQSVSWLNEGRLVVPSPSGLCQVWNLGQDSQGTQSLYHGSVVQQLSLRTDGRFLGTFSGGTQARLISIPKSEQPVVLLNHRAKGTEIHFRPNSSTLVTLGGGPSIRLWDSDHPENPIRDLEQSEQTSTALFSPNGSSLASVAQNGQFTLWDFSQQGRALDPVPLLRQWIPANGRYQVAWSRENRYVAVGVGPTQLAEPGFRLRRGAYLWNVSSLQPVGPGLDVPPDVSCLAFSRDGLRVAVGCWNGYVRVFWAQTGLPSSPILQHAFGVSALEFDTAGSQLFTGALDQSIRVWNSQTGELLRSDLRVRGEILHMSLSASGHMLLVGSLDGTVGLWDPNTLESVAVGLWDSGPIRVCQWSPTGSHLIFGGVDRRVHLVSMNHPRLNLQEAERYLKAMSPFLVDASGRPREVSPLESMEAWKQLLPP